MFTHCGFLMPERKTVSLMAMSSPNIYNYQMTFKDTFSITNYISPDPSIDFGPVHADDLYYQVIIYHIFCSKLKLIYF